MDNQNTPNPINKLSSLWVLLILLGCLLPVIVICVGTLLTGN